MVGGAPRSIPAASFTVPLCDFFLRPFPFETGTCLRYSPMGFRSLHSSSTMSSSMSVGRIDLLKSQQGVILKEFEDKYCKGRGYGRSRRYWVLVAFAISHATYKAPCRITAV